MAGLGAGARAQWLPELWSGVGVAPSGPQYTRADGLARSSFVALNSAGEMLGTSEVWAGNDSRGLVGWHWSQSQGLRLIGPFGANPASAQGYAVVTPQLIDGDGRAAGTESDYSVPVGGRVAWVRQPDGASAILGLTDAEHTGSYRFSRPVALGPQGLVVGATQRLGNEFDRGVSLWSWRPGAETVRLGYFDALHTRPSNYKSTTLSSIFSDGTVCGQSEMGVTHPSIGQYGISAWVWSAAGGQERIGLTGGEYELTSGYQRSAIAGVSQLGIVAGVADRFANGSDRGLAAWVYRRGSGEGTVRIGLVGTGYEFLNGLHTSVVKGVSRTGMVAGWTAAYNAAGNTYLGNDAWVWEEGMGTVRTGFSDATHVHASGSRNSVVVRVYPGGMVAGTSRRLPHVLDANNSAWVWTRATGTVRVGLFDDAHTLANGYQTSEVYDFGDWCVVGRSVRATPAGSSYWAWTPQRGTRRVGLSGTGYGTTEFIASNSRGQLLGLAHRVSPQSGRSGWFYDPASDTVTALDFSVSPDGQSMTQPEALTEDGVVIGYYTVQQTQETRPFAWSLERGFLDLTALVPGGWPNPQWRFILGHWANAGRTVVLGGSQPGGLSHRYLPFVLTAPPLFDLCGAGDIGGAGGLTPGDGQLDNNDFIVFIDYFFNVDPRADRGAVGGVPGSDGQFDNNDFIVFIDQFFAGC